MNIRFASGTESSPRSSRSSAPARVRPTPALDGLADIGFLTSENVFELERAPQSLIIIGGGPIGIEMAQGMNRLGVKTTAAPARIDESSSETNRSWRTFFSGSCGSEGVDVQLNADLDERGQGGRTENGHADAPADEQAAWSAEEVLVAAGRKPNIEALGLERVGVMTRATRHQRGR